MDKLVNRKTRLLFVCTSNLDRSPLAEEICMRTGKYEVKSAGFQPAIGKQKLNLALIQWADQILVMNELRERHKTTLLDIYPDSERKIVVLDVPNTYCRNDPELKKLLKARLAAYL